MRTSPRAPWSWSTGCPRRDSDPAAGSHCRCRRGVGGCWGCGRGRGRCSCYFAVADSSCRTRCSIARRRPRRSASGRNPCWWACWTVTGELEAGRAVWGQPSGPSGPSLPRPMAVMPLWPARCSAVPAPKQTFFRGQQLAGCVPQVDNSKARWRGSGKGFGSDKM